MRSLEVLMPILPLVLLSLSVVPDVLAQQAPVAPERPARLEKHGHVRLDPYFWLRERENPDVIAHLEAENAYFDQAMAPLADLREELFREIKGRIPENDASVPYRLGAHEYYHRYVEGGQYPIHARRALTPGAAEQVLLDVNELARGHGFYSARVSPASVSPSRRYLAWAADTTGRRFYTIRVLDMETNRLLEDVLEGVTGNLVWANDDRTLFYSRQDPETLRSYRIYRHEMGTDPAADALVYEEQDETFSTFVTKTKNDAYLLISSTQTLATEVRYLKADDPTGTFRVFTPRRRGHEYEVEHAGNAFYIRTNREAENFRLMRTPAHHTAEEHWEEVIPHRSDVFLDGFEVFRDFLVVEERENGLTRLRIQPWADPEAGHDVTFDDPAYAVYPDVNPTFDTNRLRFVYESPTTPETTYDYDMATRTRTLLKRDEVPGGFDPADYQAERLMVPARDGARVPVTLVYRRDRYARNGAHPLLLYGYGSYGHSIQPTFSAERLSLLDRGFAFAIAHIRGSQTLGRRWYEDGKLLRKKNTFTDFIDVAEYLAAERYADRARLYAMGGSAGGLLMGAVMNLRPDLFDGLIAHVPWVDVVTTMLDDTIPLTTSEYDEWGNPNDSTYYAYMRSYSPYDNVEAKAYPSLLVTAGLHDSQVQYWEPAKWVARLRALKTDDNLLLLHTNMKAGHGGASGRYERYREAARDYAFLIHLAGRKAKALPGDLDEAGGAITPGAMRKPNPTHPAIHQATHQAYVLWLIRRAPGLTWQSLCAHFGLDPESLYTGQAMLLETLTSLQRAGLIETAGNLAAGPPGEGEALAFTVSPVLAHVQNALKLSLTELARSDPHQRLLVNPIPQRTFSTRYAGDLFVLMPFEPELNPVYEDHLRAVARRLDLTVARADDFFTAEHIMDEIWTAMVEARLIIADCTNRNPNVFYEIGLAHAIGKPTILITQRAEDVPFDLRHRRYLKYAFTPRGMKAFEQALKKTIETTLAEAESLDS